MRAANGPVNNPVLSPDRRDVRSGEDATLRLWDLPGEVVTRPDR